MKRKVIAACLLFALALPGAWAQTWYTGGGGKGIRLTVGLPAGKNLAADAWLAEFVQGNLIGDLQKYSAMTIIDRQNVEKILEEQKLQEAGFYEEKNYAQIGQLTNAQYILTGSITKLPKGDFSLQLGIADVEKGTRRATFNKTCTDGQLKNAAVLRDASFDLLTQMGVTLTPEGKKALYGVKGAAVEAETALARGIAAQKSGTVVQALSYYYNAASFDPSLAEAAGRLNVLSGTVAGGNIGQNVRNDIQRRAEWLKVLKEAAAFFKDHQPYKIVYNPTLTEGKTDYQKNTVELRFELALWPTTGFGVLNNILAGMDKAGKREAWGFKDWPLGGEGRVFFNRDGWGVPGMDFTVEAALLNDKGRTIATGQGKLESQVDRKESFVYATYAIQLVTFSVKAGDITDALTVKITKIDGKDAAAAGRAGYIQIAAVGSEYKIGDKGPAGGIIFGTLGGGGKRYLEAAPADFPKVKWEEAKRLCAGYKLNGYTDWFLPSIDELALMYGNLKVQGLGNFKNGENELYWSALLPRRDLEGWLFRFSDGGKYSSYSRSHHLRAIRAF
jgi:hypothetical protein